MALGANPVQIFPGIIPRDMVMPNLVREGQQFHAMQVQLLEARANCLLPISWNTNEGVFVGWRSSGLMASLPDPNR